MTHNDKLKISDLAEAQGCIRDLVALSALPALWVGSDVRTIARGAADALFSMVRPIVVYVAIKDTHTGAITTETARTNEGWQTETATRHLGRTFAPWMSVRESFVGRAIHNPLGEGMARMLVVPIGFQGQSGFIAAASQLIYFPSPVERLLLSVGANQTAVAIENANLLAHKQESESLKQATSRIHSGLWTLLREDDPNDLTITRARLVKLLSAKEEHGEQMAHWLGELHKTSQGLYASEDALTPDDNPPQSDRND